MAARQLQPSKGAVSERSFTGTVQTAATASTEDSASLYLEKGAFVRHLRLGDRIHRYIKHTEQSLFAAVYAMAQENAFRVKYSLFGQFIDFLQLLAFSFSTDFGWNREYELIFSAIIGPFKSISWSAYQVMFWLCVSLIACALLVAVYVGNSFKKSDFHLMWPIQVLRTVVNLLVTVLFIPVTAVLLTVLKADGDGTITRFASDGIKVWTGTTIIYGTVSILALILFVPFCMLMGLLNFEFGSRTKDLMARHSSRLDFIYLVAKATLVFVTDLASEQVHLRLFLLFSLTVALVSMILLFVPYYKPTMNYIRTMLLGTLFGASISTIIRVYVPTISRLELVLSLILHIGIALIFGVLTTLAMYLRITPYSKSAGSVYQIIAAGRISAATKEASIPQDIRMSSIRVSQRRGSKMSADMTGRARASVARTQSNPDIKKSKWPTILISIYHYYISAQVQLSTTFLQSKNERDSVEVAETLYQHMLTRYPDAVFLKLLYTNFLLGYKNDWIAAMTQIRRIKAMKPNFDMRWLMYVLNRQVEREMKSARVGTSKTMGLMSFVDFQHNFGLARKYHAHALKKIRMFWEIVLLENTSLSRIGAANNAMVKVENRATQAYSRVLHKFPESPLLWRMYGQYLQEVQNDEEGAQGAYLLADDTEEKQTKQHANNFGGSNPTIAPSPSPLGTVVSRSETEPHSRRSSPTKQSISARSADDISPTRPGPLVISTSAQQLELPSIEPLSAGIDRRQTSMQEEFFITEEDDTGSETDSHKGSTLGGSQKTGTSVTDSTDRVLKRKNQSRARHPIIATMVERFNITFVILVLVVIGNYVAVSTLLSTRSVSVISAVDLRVHSLDAGIAAFKMALHMAVNNTEIYDESQLSWRLIPSSPTEHYNLILHDLDEIEKDFHTMYSDASGIKELSDYFSTATVTLTKFLDGHAVTDNVHLSDAIVDYVSTTRRFATWLQAKPRSASEIKNNIDLPFVVSASRFEMPKITTEVVNRYKAAYESSTAALLAVVVGIGALVIVALVGIEILVFYPTLKSFHHEKHIRLSLLGLVPKRDIMQLVKKYRDYEVSLIDAGEEEGTRGSLLAEDENDMREKYSRRSRYHGNQQKQEQHLVELARAHDKVCKEFRPLYIKAILVLALVAMGIMGQVLFSATNLTGEIELMERVSDTRRLENAMGGLVLSSLFTVESVEELVDISVDWDSYLIGSLDEFLLLHNALLYGNASMGLSNIRRFMNPVRQKLYDDNILPRTSELVQAYTNLLASNHSANTYMRPEYTTLQRLWDQPGTLKHPLRADSVLYNKELDESRVFVLSMNDVFLPLLLVFLVIYFVVVQKFMVSQLTLDDENTMKLLYTLPIESIRAVAPIKQFISDRDDFMSRLNNMSSKSAVENDAVAIKVSDYAERIMETNKVACVVLAVNAQTIVYANAYVSTMFRYDSKALVGMKCGDLVPPLHRVSLANAVNEVKSKQGGHTVELRITGLEKDGSTLPLHVRVHHITMHRGKLRNHSAICIEFEPVSTSNASIAPESHKYKQLWDLIWSQTPALMIDMNGVIDTVNSSAAVLLDRDTASIESQSLESLLAPSGNDGVWRTILEGTGAVSSSVTRVDAVLKLPSRLLNVRLVMRTIDLGNSTDFRKAIVVIEDMTEHTRIEARASRIQHERNALLSTVSSAAIGLDSTGTITFISSEAVRMLKMEHSSGAGMHISKLVCGGDDWSDCIRVGTHRIVMFRGDGTEITVSLDTRAFSSYGLSSTIWYLEVPDLQINFNS